MPRRAVRHSPYARRVHGSVDLRAAPENLRINLGDMKTLNVPPGRSAIAAAVLGLLLAAPAGAQDLFSSRSPKCGPVNGKTQQDLRNVEEFCAVGIPAGAVEGAYAMGSLLWVKITRPMADQIRAANSLDAESLVRVWMRGWKQLSKSQAVTVTIEWRDIEIAKGETTMFSGDKVTIHR